MRFDILTIFPNIFDSYLNESILNRAQKKKLVDIRIHDLRKFTQDKHRTTDDRPYGGGPGMVMKVEPVYQALKYLKALPKQKTKSHRVFLLTPQGQTFNQRLAESFTKYKRITLLCGRYEGFDERIRSLVDEQISIGDYVLTGGELAALIITDAVSRLIPGVLGHEDSAKDESFSKDLKTLEYPHYTRPEVFMGKKVPQDLLSGNHQAIEDWRKNNMKKKKN